MKAAVFVFIISVFMVSCNGNQMSDKQREALRDELKNRKPVKVSEEQILTKALEEARTDLKDTMVTQYTWKEFYVKPADSIYNELWMAYQYSVEQKTPLQDNVQLYDSVVLYSKPTIVNDTLQSMLIVVLPKKEIVLKLSE